MFKMLSDHILFKETKEESRVVIADNQTPVGIGIVEEVGPGQIGISGGGWLEIPPKVKKGDKIYYIKDHALKIKEYYVCRERDVMCIEE